MAGTYPPVITDLDSYRRCNGGHRIPSGGCNGVNWLGVSMLSLGSLPAHDGRRQPRSPVALQRMSSRQRMTANTKPFIELLGHLFMQRKGSRTNEEPKLGVEGDECEPDLEDDSVEVSSASVSSIATEATGTLSDLEGEKELVALFEVGVPRDMPPLVAGAEDTLKLPREIEETRLLANVCAFFQCSLFSSLTDEPALLLYFKLHESRTAVVPSTAAVIPRQLVIQDHTNAQSHPRDAFAVFEDISLLCNRERPQFLQLEYPHRTFAIKLIESVLMNYNYYQLFCKHFELILLLQLRLFPMPFKTLSERSASRLALRDTRVFPLAQPILAQARRRPPLDYSPNLLVARLTPRCDALATGGDPGSASSAHVLTHLISAHKNLVTSRPACSASLRRCTEWGYLRATFNRTFMATTARAASRGWWRRLSAGRCRRHWDDWYRSSLEGAHCSDESAMTYIYLLGVQYLVSLSDGLTGYSFHLYNTVAVQNPPTGSTEPAGRASCDILIPLYHPSDPLLGPRRPADARLPHRVPHAHVARSLMPPPRPHSHVAALGELQHASSALRLSVSIEGLTLGLAGAGAAPQPPGL
ncbi:hypothetical protein BGY98DRAFT_936829 [Russula aff. rugulosa BPL654]|nr:hypothetical protein BGY98DRAFT_936829 [Russula aff. rugulosa BPL654]